MIGVFHGTDEATHDAYRAWRREHPDGFNMTEGATGAFTIHWAQDRRENNIGRGCTHQGVSDIKYREDKDGCYTTARKVCAETFEELIAWAAQHECATKNCRHCDTTRFPFPVVSR